MKIFVATPQAKVLTDNELWDEYEYNYVLESYFYVSKNIRAKHKEVVDYNNEVKKKKESKT